MPNHHHQPDPAALRRAERLFAPANSNRTKKSPRILSFREYRNPAGSMLGFLNVELTSGLVLHNCKLMVGPKGKRFIAPPSEKRRDQADRPVLDPTGRPVYDPAISFRDRETRARFNAAILAVLRVTHPSLFSGEPAP